MVKITLHKDCHHQTHRNYFFCRHWCNTDCKYPSGDYFCRVGHGTCKAAKSARHLIESKEKNRSSRVKVFSTHINLSHPAASWLATQTCANNIFNLLQNNNAIYLFKNDNKIELRMGYDSFFSIETIDKINKENIKEIKLKNDTTYVSLPNPTILITNDINT